MLEIKEVNAITEQWKATAPGMIDLFKKLPVINDSKLWLFVHIYYKWPSIYTGTWQVSLHGLSSAYSTSAKFHITQSLWIWSTIKHALRSTCIWILSDRSPSSHKVISNWPKATPSLSISAKSIQSHWENIMEIAYRSEALSTSISLGTRTTLDLPSSKSSSSKTMKASKNKSQFIAQTCKQQKRRWIKQWESFRIN